VFSVPDVNKPQNNILIKLLLTIITKMPLIPDVVADPTDTSTLWLDISPEPTTGDHFEPLFCPDFPYSITLPPNIESDDAFGIWSLFFTYEIIEIITKAINVQAQHRKPSPSLSNRLAKTQLPRSCSCQWFDLTI
jgi:hypothetical protein